MRHGFKPDRSMLKLDELPENMKCLMNNSAYMEITYDYFQGRYLPRNLKATLPPKYLNMAGTMLANNFIDVVLKKNCDRLGILFYYDVYRDMLIFADLNRHKQFHLAEVTIIREIEIKKKFPCRIINENLKRVIFRDFVGDRSSCDDCRFLSLVEEKSKKFHVCLYYQTKVEYFIGLPNLRPLSTCLLYRTAIGLKNCSRLSRKFNIDRDAVDAFSFFLDCMGKALKNATKSIKKLDDVIPIPYRGEFIMHPISSPPELKHW